MKSNFEKVAIVTVICGAGLLLAGAICAVGGLRINGSRSIPLGVYVTSNKPLARGDYVLLCPPPQAAAVVEARRRGYLSTGFCPGDYGYMMKMVFAVQGDAVSVTDGGVSVNGMTLPFSVPLVRDAAGRLLPHYRPAPFTLGESEVLLMSDVSSTSFDGRYFGPVNRSQIKSVIVPILTW